MTTQEIFDERFSQDLEKSYIDDHSTDFQNNVSTLALFARLTELEKAQEVTEQYVPEDDYDLSESQRANSVACVRDLSRFIVENGTVRRRKAKTKALVRHTKVSLGNKDFDEDGWFSDPNDISSFDTIREECVKNANGPDLNGRGYQDNQSNGFVYNIDLSSTLFQDDYSSGVDSIFSEFDVRRRKVSVKHDSDNDATGPATDSHNMERISCVSYEHLERVTDSENPPDGESDAETYVPIVGDIADMTESKSENLLEPTSGDTTTTTTEHISDIIVVKTEIRENIENHASASIPVQETRSDDVSKTGNSKGSHLNEINHSVCSECAEASFPKIKSEKICISEGKSRLISKCEACGGTTPQVIKAANDGVYHYCGQLNYELNRLKKGKCCLENCGYCCEKYFPSLSKSASIPRPNLYFEEAKGMRAYPICAQCYWQQFNHDQNEKINIMNRIEIILKQLQQKDVEIRILSNSFHSPKISLDVWSRSISRKHINGLHCCRSCETVNLLRPSPECHQSAVQSRKMSITPPAANSNTEIGSVSLTISKSSNELLRTNKLRSTDPVQPDEWIDERCSCRSSGSSCSGERSNTRASYLKMLNREVELTNASMQRLEKQILQLQDCLTSADKRPDLINPEKAKLLDDTRRQFEDLEFSLVELQAHYEHDSSSPRRRFNCHRVNEISPNSCPEHTFLKIQESDFTKCTQPAMVFKRHLDAICEQRDRLISELSNVSSRSAFASPTLVSKEHANLTYTERELKALSDQYSHNSNLRCSASFPTQQMGCAREVPTNNHWNANNKLRLVDMSTGQTTKQMCTTTTTIPATAANSQCCNCFQSVSSISAKRLNPNSRSPFSCDSLLTVASENHPRMPWTATLESSSAGTDWSSNLIRPMPVDLFQERTYTSTAGNTNEVAANTLEIPIASATKQPDSLSRNKMKPSTNSTETSFGLDLRYGPESTAASYRRGMFSKLSAVFSPPINASCNDQCFSLTCRAALPPSSSSVSSTDTTTHKLSPSSTAHSRGIAPQPVSCIEDFSTARLVAPSLLFEQNGRFWCSCSSSSMSSSPPSSSSSISARRTALKMPPKTDTNKPCPPAAVATNVQYRAYKTRKQDRPLTRYLPIPPNAEDFDLRLHIENAGHLIEPPRGSVAPSLELTETACRGYLMKMGQKFRTWHKRWFVFDRSQRMLFYYAHHWDERKHQAKGCIMFKRICEVYVDHLNAARSPSSKSTFVVKTTNRPYYLVAPTAEAMRIWVDVIITGAEGHYEYKTSAAHDEDQDECHSHN